MIKSDNQTSLSRAPMSALELFAQQSYIISTLVFYITAAITFIKSFINLSPDNNGKQIFNQDKIKTNTQSIKNESDLFPLKSEIQPCQLKDIKECSTQLGTRLVPVKKENGEIEWKFVEDNSNKGTAVNKNNQVNNTVDFNIPSTEFFDEQLAKIQANKKIHRHHQQQFSPPISEASSTNDSSIENLKLNNELPSPASTSHGLSPPLHEKQQQQQLQRNMIDLSPQSSNKSHSSMDSLEDGEMSEDEILEDGTIKKSKKKHVCPKCSATFRIRGYLTRHMKKHSSEKLYTCPFYSLNSNHKCHATGGFSRRDTYKTHLKSRHFKYPSGTKSASRTGMIGWCGLCGQSFANNEIWVETHIESGECSGLPDTYQKRDSTKKKTGKRSHLLDAVSTLTPPPLDMKKSPGSSSHASSSPQSPASTSYHHETARTTLEPMSYNTKNFRSEDLRFTGSNPSTVKYHSPMSAYSPLPTQPLQQQQQQEQQKQDSEEQLVPNLEAFYYQPTQYQTIPFKNTNIDSFTSTNAVNQSSQEDVDEFAPLDDGFYQIKHQALNNPVFDRYRNQFPDFGI